MRIWSLSLCHCVIVALKFAVHGAISTAFVQVINLLFAGANTARAGAVIARAAFGLHLVFSKNEELTRGQRDLAAFVVLSRISVVVVSNLIGIVASSSFPVVANTAHCIVIYRSTVFVGPQRVSLTKCFLKHASNI